MMTRMVDPLEPESGLPHSFLSGMLLRRLDALAVISPLPHCPGTVVLLLFTQEFICGPCCFSESVEIASLLQLVMC